MRLARPLTLTCLSLAFFLSCKGGENLLGDTDLLSLVDVVFPDGTTDGEAPEGWKADAGEVDVPPVACKTDDDCAASLEAPAPWKCQGYFCQKSIGQCVLASLPEGTPCEVRGKCEKGGYCDSDGECIGVPITCSDHNPCTDDDCDDIIGCIFTDNSDPCDDGNPCTLVDECQSGSCVGLDNHCACKSDDDCKTKEDGDLCNGTLYCPVEYCEVDPSTIVECPEPDEECREAHCEPSTGACGDKPSADGEQCADEDPCTLDEKCDSGACVGAGTLPCNDGDPCTLDVCMPFKGCSYTPDTSQCDDGNPCTDDSCDPSMGCLNVDNTAVCEDGNPCTVGDACMGGVCVGGANQCECQTIDECKDKEDGDACNGTLYCFENQCVVDPATIVFCPISADPCLQKVCVPATGACIDEPAKEGGDCSDDDACTEGDVCVSGVCTASGSVDCNDSDPCTDDACDPASGCINAPIPDCDGCLSDLYCDDGNACNGIETCDLTSGNCDVGSPVDCHDGVECTDDVCDKTDGSCSFPPAADGKPCDDGIDYTLNDKCAGGECKGVKVLGVFRVEVITSVEPEVAVDLGFGPVVVNDLIEAYLTASLDAFAWGGLVALFDPLWVGYPDADLTFGEGACAFEGELATACNVIPWASHASFDGVAFQGQGSCSDDPSVTAPCFATPQAAFDIGALVPEFFGGSQATIDGLAAGGFTGDPVSWIEDGFVAGFLPKSVVESAANDLSLDLGGGPITLTDLLADVPTTMSGGVEGWDVRLGFKARRVDLLDLPGGCNLEASPCNDGDDCTLDQCDPFTGDCTNPPVVCDDGDACNGSETCEPVGGCQMGTPPVCDDGDACNGAETCEPAVGCVDGPDPVCADATVCTDDSCDSLEGCLNLPAHEGEFCSEGTVTSGTCQDGVCVPSCKVDVDCAPPGQCRQPGVCDPVSGECTYAALPDGTGCDDGDLCTKTDGCFQGECAGGDEVTCEASDECTDVGTCNPTTGKCSHPAKPDGAPCNDGNLCTEDDECAGGVCTAVNEPLTCPDPDSCHDVGTCEPSTGVCSYPAKANDTDCDDGDLCNGVSTCQGGSCTQTTAPVTCTALDECHDVGTCEPSTGVCSDPAKANDTDCDDGDLCNGVSTCQDGSCTQTTAPVTCAALDECHEVGTCEPSTGVCSDPVKANDTDCDDGNLCNGVSTCQDGSCTQTTAPVTCAALDECHDVGTCEPSTGVCSDPAKTNDTDCDDGDLCNGVSTCQYGSCTQTTAPVTCAALDECHDVGTCEPSTGVCSDPAKANDTDCDDGNLCNGVSTCQDGACTQTTAPVTCSALDECHDVGTCEPSTGVCSDPAKANDADCDDGNLCNGVSTCQDGACTQTTAPVTCAALDECHDVGTCEPSTGVCSDPDKPDKTDCTGDGDPCTDDECLQGVCSHTPAPDDCGPRVCGPSPSGCYDCGECETGFGCNGSGQCDNLCDGVQCPECQACEAGACVPSGDGSWCSTDDNECTTDKCSQGTCAHEPVAPGTDCDDGDLCNGVSTCQGVTCTQTTAPVTCTALDECHEVGTCEPSTGVCSDPAKANDTDCDDGNLCNGVSTCQGGSCTQTTEPVTCTALDECHDIGTCEPSTGVCSDPAKANDTDCDDGNLCNGVSTCQGGSCTQTTSPVTCTALDECHDIGTCEPSTGVCSNPAKANDTDCDDGNLCNGVSTCQGGSCTQTTSPVTCTALDECHDVGTCEPSTGVCSDPAKANDTDCDDGNLCNGVSTCQGGSCTQTTSPVTCTALDECHDVGTCEPSTGVCSDPAKANDTDCDDGNLCNGVSTCQGGSCTQTTSPVTCTALDECHDVGTCEPSTGVCSDPAKANDTDCDDGNLCNGVSTCQGGSCTQTTSPVTCTALDECHEVGTCNQFTGNCTNPVKSDDSDCDDGNLCNGVGTCQGGVCTQTTAPVTCAALDECHDVGTCEPSTGVCSDPAKADDTDCDDGDMCNGVSTCQGGACTQTTAPVTCTALDVCHRAGNCIPATGECTNPVHDDDTDCDDGNLCNGVNTCQGGSCTQTTPPVTCTALDQCHDIGTCNTGTGVCSDPAKANDTDCDDLDACTNPDVCTDGVCGGADVVCDDNDPCTTDSCDSLDGCQTSPVPGCIPCINDLDCVQHDDGNLCNGTLACYDDDGASCDNCAHGACLFDPATVITCSENPAPCIETVCVQSDGTCTDRDLLDGSPCDDGDGCTSPDTCVLGVCGGLDVDCDDTNACTDDSCVSPTGCQYANNTNACDDGDSCTTGDQCDGGACVGTPDPTCVCDVDGDCAAFEDDDLCNGTLVCVAHRCEVDPSTVVSCPQPPECRTVKCLPDAGLCQFYDAADGSACDDSDECTQDDKCSGGACSGISLDCFDQDPCTDDDCDPASGCVFTYNSNPCDDANPCTDQDQCTLGSCIGQPVPGCECVIDDDCAPFEDGDLCNGLLKCVEKTCVTDLSTVVTCPDPAPDSCQSILCNPSSGNCDTSVLADGKACDDGNNCTTQDACDTGACVGTPECAVNGDCDDSDDCTDDVCNPSGCCEHAFNTASCDDGDSCTTGDVCDQGVCAGTNTCPGNCDPVLKVDCGFSDVWSVFNPGSTDGVISYACAQSFIGAGPRYAYRFTAPYDGYLNIGLVSEMDEEDTAVILLSNQGNGCNGNNCMDWSYTGISDVMAEGLTYYIVVDGEDPIGGGYTITVDCLPIKEQVCDDGIDDDQDGLTDCADVNDCSYTEACPVAHCEQDWTLYCGYGDSWSVYGGGNTNLIEDYSCASGVFDGPEYTYEFVAPIDGEYTVTLSNTGGDMDVFVVEATEAYGCFPDECIAHGDSSAVFTAVKDQTYFFVVDSPLGQGSYFTIDVDCPCIPQCELWWDCGDDGCGGTCGTGCSQDEICLDGSCYLPICPCDPNVGQTVCGYDGQDYANDVCAACALCQEETPWCVGCQGTRDCDQSLPLDPVVGYMTQLAGCDVCVCNNNDECAPLSLSPPCDTQQLCSDQYVTYDSPCEMKEAYGCDADYVNHLFNYGACQCPTCVGQPSDPKVCSDQGVTYPNSCILTNCPINGGEGLDHLGACLDQWFCAQCAPASSGDEVCGDDGITYANECAATTPECGNTTVAHTGVCT